MENVLSIDTFQKVTEYVSGKWRLYTNIAINFAISMAFFNEM